MISIKASNVFYTSDIKTNDDNSIQNINKASIIDIAKNRVLFKSVDIEDTLKFVRENNYDGNEDNLRVIIDNDIIKGE